MYTRSKIESENHTSGIDISVATGGKKEDPPLPDISLPTH